jgi:hypothetical protein
MRERALIVFLNGLTEKFNRMVCYPKPAVEDITRSPLPGVPVRQPPGDARQPGQPEDSINKSKVIVSGNNPKTKAHR